MSTSPTKKAVSFYLEGLKSLVYLKKLTSCISIGSSFHHFVLCARGFRRVSDLDAQKQKVSRRISITNAYK